MSTESTSIPRPQIDTIYFEEYRERMNSGASEKAESIFPHINPNLPPYRILSIGAGGGGLESEMSQAFRDQKILAVDYSLPMIEALQNQQENSTKDKKVECVGADASSIPFEKSSISTVIASSVIHEIATFGDKCKIGDTTDQFFREVWRVLAPGGRLIIRDFMQYPQSDKMIKLIIGKKQEADPTDPISFLKNFITDFKGSDLSYLKQQTSRGIVSGMELTVTLADALEIGGHYSWSKRYDAEVKERYAYMPIEEYVTHIKNHFAGRQLPFSPIFAQTAFQPGYAEHINGRLDFYPNGDDSPPIPPILTGIIVFEKPL